MTDHYWIRHADAGVRGTNADDRRPLSKRGRAQAEAIAKSLADRNITRVLSSPYRRCLQTVEPLAATLGLAVEPADGLAEGAGPQWVLDQLLVSPSSVAWCSHGDVLGAALATLYHRGVPLDDDRLQKGGVWVVRVTDGEVGRARYRPAP